MKQYQLSARLLMAVTFFFWFSQYVYTPYVNPELAAMGASAAFMGLVGGLYGFVQLVLRIPLGITADRLQKQKLFICFGCICSAVSGFGMAAFPSPGGFLLFRAMGGMGAANWVSFTVLYSSYFAPEESTRAITYLGLPNQLGRLSSFFVLGAFLHFCGPRVSFLLSGAAGLCGLLAALFLKETRPSGSPLTLRQLVSVVGDRNLRATSALAVLAQVVAFGTFFSFTFNAAAALGANQTQLSRMNIALFLPVALGNFFAAKCLLRRLGARVLLVTGFGLVGVYCALVPLAATVPQLYVLQAVGGIGSSFTMSILPGLCVQNIAPEKRSTAMGFFQAVYGVGMTLGPMLMGVMADGAGLSAAFFVMAAISVATAAAALWLMREAP